jgi:hypothetical protein
LVIRLKKFRVAVIVVLPVAMAPLTIIYSLLARRDVIAITGLRFPFNYLIYNDKMAQS